MDESPSGHSAEPDIMRFCSPTRALRPFYRLRSRSGRAASASCPQTTDRMLAANLQTGLQVGCFHSTNRCTHQTSRRQPTPQTARLSRRLALGASIKAIVANEAHHYHRKYCSGITLRPFWRLTITLNDEPETMLVLLPLDEHVADKIVLLRASRYPLLMPTITHDERHEFWQRLMSELPAFLHFLLHEYEPPVELRDVRYVVAGWHHPELAEALHGLSPAAALLGLIDYLAPWGSRTGDVDLLPWGDGEVHGLSRREGGHGAC